MKRIPLILALLIASLYAASTTVTQLVETVRAQLHKALPDKTVAKAVGRLELSEKLSLRAIEELESEGAGPETVAALDKLRELSEKRPASKELPPFQSPSRPDVEEQVSVFREINRNANRYSQQLPDFICTQTVRRFTQGVPSPIAATSRRLQTVMAPSPGTWTPSDVLTVRLSYFDGRENYKLELVNGRKTSKSYLDAGGAISQGEFGSMLVDLFAPESHTKFQWDHWTHLRKRLTRVYAYTTAQKTSHYKIVTSSAQGEQRTAIAGRHGFVYADDETKMVMRISGEADDLPPGFPVIGQESILDYEFANVGENRFLLPLRAENRMWTRQAAFKNILEYKSYRKFTGESSIHYETTEDPQPDAKPETKPEVTPDSK